MNVLSKKWINIKVRRTDPLVYPRYFRQVQETFQPLKGDHFFLQKFGIHFEVFYEQMDAGLWILSMEIKGKTNNRYIVQPKKSVNFYSIDVFSTSGKLGYKSGNSIEWTNEQLWFITPETEFELFQEKDTVVKCFRIIFTRDYMIMLMKANNDSLKIENNIQKSFHRMATKAELLLQFRVINILRYERGKYHYKASLLSNIFEQIAFFLNRCYLKCLMVN